MEGDNIPKWLRQVRHGHQFGKKLVPDNVHFNLDHLFRIGKKSFVAYPYNYKVADVEPFRQYLEKKGFVLWFDPYPTEYGYDTHKVMIIHISEYDDFFRSPQFEKDFEIIRNKQKYNLIYWNHPSRRSKIAGEIGHSGNIEVTYDESKKIYSIGNCFGRIRLSYKETLDVLKCLEHIQNHYRNKEYVEDKDE